MNPMLEEILRSHAKIWQITYVHGTGRVIVRTKRKNNKLVGAVERWLNKPATVFGMVGPYKVEWEKLA